MASEKRFIVVDEYDSVFKSFSSRLAAESFAEELAVGDTAGEYEVFELIGKTETNIVSKFVPVE